MFAARKTMGQQRDPESSRSSVGTKAVFGRRVQSGNRLSFLETLADGAAEADQIQSVVGFSLIRTEPAEGAEFVDETRARGVPEPLRPRG